MLNFILTVIKENLLDVCEVFENQDDALSSAEYFCRYNNIPLHDGFSYDNHAKAWLVADSYGYFVTVTYRPTHTSRYTPSSYHTFLDTLSGSNYRFSKNISVLGKDSFLNFLYSPPRPIPAIPVAPPAPKDDPKDLSLPGGFAFLNDKPMTMKEVSEDPLAVRSTLLLNDNQKWALVTARVKHRPNIDYTIFGGLKQSSVLNELQQKTAWAKTFVQEQVKEIQSMYDDFTNNHHTDPSSSTYYEDESSSSEELDE